MCEGNAANAQGIRVRKKIWAAGSQVAAREGASNRPCPVFVAIVRNSRKPSVQTGCSGVSEKRVACNNVVLLRTLSPKQDQYAGGCSKAEPRFRAKNPQKTDFNKELPLLSFQDLLIKGKFYPEC
jgi:hypothetical protein